MFLKFFFLLSLSLLVACQEKAKPYIFINDTTDHRFDESIRMSILAAQKRTGVQNAVVISDKKLDVDNLFKELNVGKLSKGKGILYLFSPKEKFLKIEVSYGLEGIMPDMKVKGFELAAKSFTYSDRYQDFWAELINTINIDLASNVKDDFDYSNFHFLSGGAGVTSITYEQSLQQFQDESRSLVKSDKFRAQKTIKQTLEQYFESLKMGVGDSNLDLLTEEARFRRVIIPNTNFQLYRNHKMYLNAGIDKIFEAGNLAFIFFHRNHPVLPIILRKEENVWRVHEPMSWSLFQRFEDTNRVFLKHSLKSMPKDLDQYISSLGEPLYRKPTFSLKTLGKILDKTPTVKELYLHLSWPDIVVKKLGDQNLKEKDLWMLADSYQNLGQFKNFLMTYEKIAKIRKDDYVVQKNLKFYKENIIFNDNEWKLKL